MNGVWRRIPDFAGIALVDILANSVGMLIIVIVISIAAGWTGTNATARRPARSPPS